MFMHCPPHGDKYLPVLLQHISNTNLEICCPYNSVLPVLNTISKPIYKTVLPFLLTYSLMLFYTNFSCTLAFISLSKTFKSIMVTLQLYPLINVLAVPLINLFSCFSFNTTVSSNFVRSLHFSLFIYFLANCSK